ncbi:MAG TPA: hypothetical protein PKM72_14910, partial [Nitrospirales bacterium]|nr:hypothetical protein [Nitrospirales bacterium]
MLKCGFLKRLDYGPLVFILILGSGGLGFTNSSGEEISPQTLMEDGSRHYQQGQLEQATRSWTQAA